jgi:hypothetical protein
VSAKLARRDQLSGSGPVRYKIQSMKDGVQTAMLAIDYSEAPVPPHYYVADYYEVVNRDPQILFTFGKLNYPNENQLRNKLEIDFPAQHFIVQLWRSAGEFHKMLRAFVRQFGYQPVAPGSISEPVEKVQTIHSNNALMIQSGGECMIDFFYLSPRDMALKMPKSESVLLEPLVRVIMSPNLLLGLLDACEPIAESLTSKFGRMEEEHATVESE